MDSHELAKKFYEDFNQHDLDALERLCAGDCSYTDMVSGETFEGQAGFRKAAERWISAFPDAKCEIVNQVVSDDFIVTELLGTGTQNGPLAGPGGTLPATGKHGELACCEIFRLRDGKIVSGRFYYDALTLLTQLGVAAGAQAETKPEAQKEAEPPPTEPL